MALTAAIFPKDKLWRQLQEHLETELNNASDIPQSLIDDQSSSDQEKALRFREQISYAKDKGIIDKTYEYLSSSSIDDLFQMTAGFHFPCLNQSHPRDKFSY